MLTSNEGSESVKEDHTVILIQGNSASVLIEPTRGWKWLISHEQSGEVLVKGRRKKDEELKEQFRLTVGYDEKKRAEISQSY